MYIPDHELPLKAGHCFSNLSSLSRSGPSVSLLSIICMFYLLGHVMDTKCYKGNVYSNVSGEFNFVPFQCTVAPTLHCA